MNPVDVVHQDPEASLIAELRADLDELSSRQIIGGASLSFYQSESGDQYDWDGTLPESPSDPSTGHKVLRVEAVAEKQNVLFADIIFELYVGSLTTRYTIRDYLEDIEAFAVGFRIMRIPQPLSVEETNTARFGIAILGDKTTHCYAKFYVVANDTVSLSVTELN